MNQVLTFSRSLFISQAKMHPEDAEAIGEAAKDLQLLATPPVAADTNAIQTLFMQIARDIKKNAESTAEKKQKATAEVLNHLRANIYHFSSVGSIVKCLHYGLYNYGRFFGTMKSTPLFGAYASWKALLTGYK